MILAEYIQLKFYMMKKLFVLIVLIVGIIWGTEAQSKGITFEQTKEWKKVLKKAKKEKKLIFIDCYTSWCGPCKMLSSQVFTREDVGNQFNADFINVKYDMEKDADGVMLKDKFEVKAFPTLVFVDPNTQQVVHKMVGAGSAEWLMEGGKIAKDPQNNLSGLTKRYEAGERNIDLLSRYLAVLASAYMQEKQGAVATEYLNALSDDEIATKENWDLIKKNITDPLSKPLKQVIANIERFYEVAGKEVVDYKLEMSIKGAVAEIVFWRPGNGEFDEVRNTELIKLLQSLDYAFVPGALANLYTAEYIRKGDYKGMLNSMREAFKYNVFRNGEDQMYFQNNIEALTGCDDKALVQEGIDWIDARCAQTKDYFNKANLMNSKARLLIQNGDTLGADKAKMEEEKYNAEGEKRSGGKAVRAIRMN